MLPCDRTKTSRASATQKLQSQQRSSSVLPVSGSGPAKRGCKPASHYEPSMIVHLPINVRLASSPFVTPPLRRHKPYVPSADSRGGRPVDAAAATLGPTSDLWSSRCYRPADSNIVAYRATVAYESNEMRPNVSAAAESRWHMPNESDRPLHEMGDVLSTGGLTSNVGVRSFMAGSDTAPAVGCDSTSKPAKSDTSVCTHIDQRSTPSLAAYPSDSARMAGGTASQLSHVCLLYVFVVSINQSINQSNLVFVKRRLNEVLRGASHEYRLAQRAKS